MFKFKLPKRINIKGAKYRIKLVDTDMFAGLCDPEKKIIYINGNQSPEQVERSFYHEIEHAMQFEIGANQAVSREMMEILAENGSCLIYDIVRIGQK